MRAAIYARKSTEQGGLAEEAKSITRQVANARAFAVARGWDVLDDHIYTDDAYSGADFTRPAYVRMMATLKPTAPFDVVVMMEESRLGREMIETTHALLRLTRAGVQPWSYLTKTERTLNTPEEKLLAMMHGFSSETERERACQRTKDALDRIASLGHVTGNRIFGYRNVPHLSPDGVTRAFVTREILPAEAELVRAIFRRYVEGWGLVALAKTLNADQAPSPRQGGWWPTTIHGMLRREIYIGQVVRNGVAREQRELRIIDQKLWDAVQARINARGQRKGRPAGIGTKYLLTGFLKCGLCGSSMQQANGGYVCSVYRQQGKTRCTNGAWFPMKEGDKAVLGAILDNVVNERLFTRAIDVAVASLTAKQPALKDAGRLTKELATVQKELVNLTNAIMAGGNMPALVEALQARETRKAQLQALLKAGTGDQAAFKADVVRREMRTALTAWQGLLQGDPLGRQCALRALIVGKLSVTASADGYAFTGLGTVQPILAGTVVKNDGSPSGSGILDSKGSRGFSIPGFPLTLPISGSVAFRRRPSARVRSGFPPVNQGVRKGRHQGVLHVSG